MPFENIVKNLYLGDQFSNKLSIPNKEVKISNIFYDIFNEDVDQSKVIFKNKNFVLTKDKIAINLLDSHDERDFNNNIFAAAVKFISENIEKINIYTHCQLGISRSASTIFVYLVINKYIKADTFDEALKEYITNFYAHMKMNLGVYTFLKNNFPFNEIQKISNKKWGEF